MGNHHFNSMQTAVMAARGTGTGGVLIPAIQAASTYLGRVDREHVVQAISTNPTLTIAQSILPANGGFTAQEAVSGDYASHVAASKPSVGRGI